MKDILILGIGNPHMGDDAIGIEIVKEIEKMNIPVKTEILYYISFELMDKLMGYKKAIIVDAADICIAYGDFVWKKYSDLDDNLSIKNSHGIGIYHVIDTGYKLFNELMPEIIDILLIQTGKIENFKRMNKDYVDKIKRLLTDKGLTYKDLGIAIGKTETTIVNYIKRRTKIDVDTLIKIAEVLEVPVSYFFEDTSDISGYNKNANSDDSKELKAKLDGCMKLLAEKDKQIELLKEMIEMLKKNK